MSIPKVTVLMSIFNGLEYLPEAMHSILSQSFDDFEFLIINDGSTDPVGQIFQEFHDSRIIVLNQDNIGLTRSLNRGLLLARGEYVARMDSDDLSLPGRLEAQVRELECDSRLDLVAGFFDIVDEHGHTIERKELIRDPIYRLWRLQFHNNYGHGSVMFRKKAVLEAGRYNSDLAYAQDFDLWSRISKRDNTKVIPQVLYHYRMVHHGTQTSVSHYDTQLANAIRISNRSLTSCNGLLSDFDCEEVRALYWKFQREHVSVNGLSLVAGTLEGFCRRFSIEGKSKSELFKRVALDAIEELHNDHSLSQRERIAMVGEFSTWHEECSGS